LVYVPIFKQGGNSNTITIVDGVKAAIKKLVDIPEALKTAVVFDQSVFVKLAISNVVREATIGLVLTGVMILVFLASPRATVAVLLSVPLAMLVCLLITNYVGGSINTMILGGLALVFSRLIDNGVIVLENIFRHMEMGEKPYEASEKGGSEVAMAVLAATFTTSIVFFPVTFFHGVSKYIFTPLALGVVLSIFASYFFAMTVVPLYCAKFINLHDESTDHGGKKPGPFTRFERWFNEKFQAMLNWYGGWAKRSMQRPGLTASLILGGVAVVLLAGFPFMGRAYFPRTDPGQFIISVKMPSGTRLEVSNDYIARVENIIRSEVKAADLDMVVSNIGVYPDLSAIYTTNASMDTAFVQTSLKEDHRIGSYEYMRRVQNRIAREMPELSAYYQAGGLVDAMINQGLPAPIDIQIKSQSMDKSYALARQLAAQVQALPEMRNVYIPQSTTIPASRWTSIANEPAWSGSPPRTWWTTSSPRLRRTAWSRPATGSIPRAATTTWSRSNMPTDGSTTCRWRICGTFHCGARGRKEPWTKPGKPRRWPRPFSSTVVVPARSRSARWPTSTRSTPLRKWITTRFAE